jgi:hypothetical protein
LKPSSEFFDVMILMIFALSAGLLAIGIILIVSWAMQQPQTPPRNLALPQLANVVSLIKS